MFGDTQAGCQRIAAAYNELLVRGIQPDRISEWFYGENGGLKVHVDTCIRTGVCDAELLFHVRGFRSASLDGGSPKGAAHGVSREFRKSSCRLLSRVSSCRRLASNVRHYRRAVHRGSKGKFLRGVPSWRTILDKPNLKVNWRGKREEAIARIYRISTDCVDDCEALEQLAHRVHKAPSLEPQRFQPLDDGVRAKIEYLRAAITKADMLSYPIYKDSGVPRAAQPIASEWALVESAELREFCIVRVLDLPALRSKVLIQRYMRPNSCGAVDGYPPPRIVNSMYQNTGGTPIEGVGVRIPPISVRGPHESCSPQGSVGKLSPSSRIRPQTGSAFGSLGVGTRIPLRRTTFKPKGLPNWWIFFH